MWKINENGCIICIKPFTCQGYHIFTGYLGGIKESSVNLSSDSWIEQGDSVKGTSNILSSYIKNSNISDCNISDSVIYPMKYNLNLSKVSISNTIIYKYDNLFTWFDTLHVIFKYNKNCIETIKNKINFEIDNSDKLINEYTYIARMKSDDTYNIVWNVNDQNSMNEEIHLGIKL